MPDPCLSRPGEVGLTISSPRSHRAVLGPIVCCRGVGGIAYAHLLQRKKKKSVISSPTPHTVSNPNSHRSKRYDNKCPLEWAHRSH